MLRPRSIAIVGASADPRSFGAFVLANLDRYGYAGDLHLVSRGSRELGGRPCVATVDELPEGIDLAVLAIPEAGVPDALRGLIARKAHAALLFASGYAEAGDAGRARQDALASMAREGGILLVGPNCMGFTNLAASLPVTFEPLPVLPAPARAGVGVVAQSGFMAANLRESFLARGLPTAIVFSTGNEADVSVEDVIAQYVIDDAVGVIVVYAEQIRRPAAFLALVQQGLQRGKPTVLLMPGRSARAREAAQSHTGALAGDHATACAVLEREGVVMARSLDELVDVAAILLRYPQPVSGGVGFLTGSGAMKNLVLDFCDDIHLELPALGSATVEALRARLPAYAVAENPLDYTTISVRNPGVVAELLLDMEQDPALAGVVLAIPVGPEVAQLDKARHIVPALARATKPAVLVFTGDGSPMIDPLAQAIAQSGVPLFRSTERALRALARVAAHGEARLRLARRAQSAPLPPPQPFAPHCAGIVAEYVGKDWLSACGIPTPRGALARDLGAATEIAARLGYPVVIKAQAAALPHKSDVGGVVVGIEHAQGLAEAWERMLASVARHRPDLALDAGLEGVLVEAMGSRGLELVVGAKRDPLWGPVVMVGLGGIWIEALKDVRLFPADLSVADIEAELMRLQGAALLRGLRGSPPIDVGAVARAVAAIGAQMQANHRIMEIDINPLIAYPTGVLALDALIVLAGETACD